MVSWRRADIWENNKRLQAGKLDIGIIVTVLTLLYLVQNTHTSVKNHSPVGQSKEHATII